MCILYVDIYIYIQLYTYMSGGQDYLLPAMDMAKVDGPISVVNVFAQCLNITCPLPAALVFR